MRRATRQEPKQPQTRTQLPLPHTSLDHLARLDPAPLGCHHAKAAILLHQRLDYLHAAARSHVLQDSTLIMQLLRDNLTLWTSEDGN
jgi:hypothetical protein